MILRISSYLLPSGSVTRITQKGERHRGQSENENENENEDEDEDEDDGHNGDDLLLQSGTI